MKFGKSTYNLFIRQCIHFVKIQISTKYRFSNVAYMKSVVAFAKAADGSLNIFGKINISGAFYSHFCSCFQARSEVSFSKCRTDIPPQFPGRVLPYL